MPIPMAFKRFIHHVYIAVVETDTWHLIFVSNHATCRFSQFNDACIYINFIGLSTHAIMKLSGKHFAFPFPIYNFSFSWWVITLNKTSNILFNRSSFITNYSTSIEHLTTKDKLTPHFSECCLSS